MSRRPTPRIGIQLIAIFAVLALLVVVAVAQASTQKTAGKLVSTVGPGFTIKLTKGGKKVKTLKPGTYRFTVRDRSPDHDFHLFGPGVNKKTGVSFTGTVVWKNVRLKKGAYTYRCDPHFTGGMIGRFKVRSASTSSGGAETGTQTGTTTTTGTSPYAGY